MIEFEAAVDELDCAIGQTPWRVWRVGRSLRRLCRLSFEMGGFDEEGSHNFVMVVVEEPYLWYLNRCCFGCALPFSSEISRYNNISYFDYLALGRFLLRSI